VLDVLVAAKLPALVKAVVDMSKALLSIKVDASEPREPKLDAGTNLSAIADHCRAVLDALEKAFSSDKRMMEELEALKFTSSGLFWDETYRASQVLRLVQQDGTAAKLRGMLALCNTAVVDVKPKHWEVQRRLAWFISSLFMDVPRPAPVARMQSWSVLTPFYSEDLLYSAKELALKNEDGISVLYFLKTVHGDEWTSFLERVGVAPKDEAQLWQDRKLALELRLWASFRGQTLVRTVEGMMLHERALRLQASWEGMRGESLEQMIRQKFSYVVSCQAYGQHKKARDPKAADTEYLVQRFRNLRVAYVDKAVTFAQGRNADGSPGAMRESVRFYSVLAKGVREGAEEVMQEVFRVQLPGDIMLGEGKPENQNHAIIFTRGEHLQAIDMNQCGYFEEALKMRNLLHEFVLQPGASIIGFREHIFTGGLSSLASYMALQEGCFVTLTQRVLWEPLKVRLHYGHPDVFDKLYSMTRGGVSKASRGINLSEDIYAGFNHMLRGGTIPYIEYMQVGKGRDVGMQQIYKFEAKLASGNGEQCLSRDVFRIGQRLDFTRLLSFYYSGIGFYLNNAATVFAMFAFMYLVLWSHTLQLDAGVPIVDLLNAQWSLQLGLLLTVPILCYLSVEHGLLHALVQLLRVWVTGAPFFFMFHMGTKAHYFDSTLKFGGAKYRPTGRGFVMIHEQFAELYRFYAASHLYNGFELLWGLLLLAKLGTWPLGAAQYWRTCWSIWAVMAAWLFSPFWFNPSAFDITKVRADLADWQLWMARKDASALSSWEAWWYEEHSSVHTHSWSKKIYTGLPAVRYFLTAGGILAALAKQPISAGLLKELRLFGSLLGIIGGGVGLLSLLRGLLRQSHLLLRVCSTCLLVVVCTAVPLVLQHTSLTNVLLLAAAAGYLFASLVRVPLALGYTPRATRLAFLVYDYFLGGLLLLLCFALTAPGFVKHVQNRALLSNTFAKGVKYAELSRLLPG
jgi:callose synthase